MLRRMHTMHGFGSIMTRQIVSQRKPTKTSDKLCSQATSVRTERCTSCKTSNTRLINCNSGCRSVSARLPGDFLQCKLQALQLLEWDAGFFSLVEHVSLSGHESSSVHHLDITCSVGSVHRSGRGIQEVFPCWKCIMRSRVTRGGWFPSMWPPGWIVLGP